MRGLGRVGVVGVVCLMVTALSGACSSEDDDTLVIYSGRTKELIGPLLEQFSEDTGLSIEIRYDDSANLALLLEEEGERSDADVFISQSPGAVGFLDEHDLLDELPARTVEKVPEGDAAPDGKWVGLSGRVRTLVYNTELVDPAALPTSVLDLTEPELAGQVALAPTNGSFQDFVTVMRNELGEEEAEAWLSAMADGDPPTFPNNRAIVEAVGRGEVPMGLVNHYYKFVAQAEDPDLPVENHFFAEGDVGSTLLVTAASIVKGTNMHEDAVRFVEFLLAGDAQRYFSEETYEFPLAAGAEPNPALPPFEDITATRVDLGELGAGLESTTELIDASGLNS